MKLNLRCAMCEQVRETTWEVEELQDASPDDVCPHCFICAECLTEPSEVDAANAQSADSPAH